MRLLLFATVLLLLKLQALSGTLMMHVSPNGNDQWSGRVPNLERGTTNGPLRTPAAALERVRRLPATERAEGVAIRLQGGLYFLDAPLVLKPEDSGLDAAHPLTLEGAPGQDVILSGGRPVAGWKRSAADPAVWEAPISNASGAGYFRQLFVNGQRKQRARTPNSGFYRIQGDSPQDKPVKIRYQGQDIQQSWAEAGDVELIALLAWADIRMFIRAVDESQKIATLSGNPRPSNREANARYYIENAPDGLDQPGEWRLDKATGLLKYWAEAGEMLQDTNAIAPVLKELIVLEGDPGKKESVRHIVFRGLTFAHTDWEIGPEGHADTQAAIGSRGDLRAAYATDCRIENCVFTQLGGYAVELGKGCQRWSIEHNRMHDLASGGIRLGETQASTEPFEQNHSHRLTDNHLHHLGVVYPPAVGVFILQSGTNLVAHNHIHDLYYTAVSVGWNWGYRETPCRENVVEFNHLHHIGKEMLSDMGAVYTLGIQHGTVIRNNLIHDVHAFTYGGWGLYPDEGSSYIVWENNVVYGCKSAGFHQHYGRENIVRNNIFAFNRENQLMRTREEDHLSFFFTNNIVYFDSGKLLGSNWSNDRFRMDGNVYFDVRMPGQVQFGAVLLKEWRKRGHDQHSLIADPEFVAPREFDFRLRPTSPALKLGFKPIDLTKVGVRKQTERRD